MRIRSISSADHKKPSKARSSPTEKWAQLPIWGIFILLVTTIVQDSMAINELPYLSFIGNTLFMSGIGYAVAFFCAKSYLTNGLDSALLLGSGLVTLGSCSFLSGVGKPLGLGANYTVTVQNVGTFLFSAFCAASTCLSSREEPHVAEYAGKPFKLTCSYLAALGVGVLVLVAEREGLTPIFFVQGHGPTPVRQFLLMISLVFMAFSTANLLYLFLRRKSTFAWWFMLGLISMMASIIAFSINMGMGSPLGWIGCAANYLGCLYLLAAVVAAYHDAGRSGQSVEESVRSFFQSGTGYRLLVENSPDIICRFEPNLRCSYINPAVEAVTGTPADTFIDKFFQQSRFEDGGEALAAAVRQAFDEETEQSADVAFHARSGLRLCQCRLLPEHDARGRTVSVLGIFRDVTETWQREERYRVLFDQVAVGLCRVDLDGCFIQVNDRWCEILGYGREEILGRSFRDFTHADDLPENEKYFLRLRSCKIDTYVLEQRKVRKDGTAVWVNLTASKERDALGRPAGVITIMEDITERKKAEEALHRREQEFRALVENSPDIIVRIGQDLRRCYINPAISTLHGLPPEHYVGMHVREPARPDREDFRRSYEELLRLVLTDGREQSLEYSLMTLNGTRHFHCRLMPEFTPSGEVGSILSVSRDVSAYKELEEKLRRARNEAEAANQAKSEFLANMSHEIRTPMNGIIGMTDLALMGGCDAKATTYLGFIKESAHSLLDLINDILDLSKVESGRMALENKPFDLRKSLDSLLQPLCLVAQRKGVVLSWSVGPDVPALLMGDDLRLRQIFTNLVGNALKFTSAGSIIVAVVVVETAGGESPDSDADPEGIVLRATVSDTGVGIPPDKFQHVFESFATLGHDKKHGGTGLGLAITKRLVEIMGGTIWVESRLGQGSVFGFTVRLARAPVTDPARREQSREPTDSMDIPLRILIAEDNEINQLVMRDWLADLGHMPICAPNGRKAIDLLSQGGLDLVFMDVQMPEMDGIEATRIIRQSPPPGVDPAIPIVALTAYALKGDRERFLAAGMDDYLSKPLDFAELSRVLAKYTRKKTKPRPG